MPAALEVAALISGDIGTDDFERDIIVETQSGILKRISVFEPSYLPLQYPLLFPQKKMILEIIYHLELFQVRKLNFYFYFLV